MKLFKILYNRRRYSSKVPEEVELPKLEYERAYSRDSTMEVTSPTKEDTQIFEQTFIFMKYFRVVKPEGNRCRSIIGMLLFILSQSMMVLSMAILRQMQINDPNMTVIEVILIRGVVQTILQGIQYYYVRPSFANLTRKDFKILAVRLIQSISSMYTGWWAFQYLNMAVYSSLQFSQTFWAILTSYYYLGEKLNKVEFVNIFFQVIGASNIVYSQELNPERRNQVIQVDNLHFIAALCAAIFCAFLVGIGATIQRRLKHMHFLINNGIYGFCLMVFTIFLWLIFRANKDIQYVKTNEQITMIVIYGVLTMASNQVYLISFRYEKAGRIMSMVYLQTFQSYMYDIFYFGYQLNLQETIGATIIFISSIGIISAKYFGYTE